MSIDSLQHGNVCKESIFKALILLESFHQKTQKGLSFG
jgi:hypothetical protein